MLLKVQMSLSLINGFCMEGTDLEVEVYHIIGRNW